MSYFRPTTLRELFNARWKPDVSGCHLWTGSISSQGYGIITRGNNTVGRQHFAAHRISWELCNGAIPHGIAVLHKCDVTRCVNPEHLFLGTQADNMRDMDAKGRRRNSPMPGEANGFSKLTEARVREARKLRAAGWIYKDIAARLGVSTSAAFDVCNRSWKHIKD